MRQISVVTALVVLMVSACAPTGTKISETPSPSEEPISTNTSTATPFAGTPYPTVPPTEATPISLLRRSLALPEGSRLAGSDEHLTSDWLPAAGFSDAMRGMKLYFSEGPKESLEGKGRMTAAIYRTEGAAKAAFQTWDKASSGKLRQGGRVASRTADEVIFRFLPPIPPLKKGGTSYQGTTSLYVRRCRLVMTLEYDDYTAGDLPIEPGDPVVRFGNYLKARDPLESSFLDSLDRTQAALEDVACSQDVLAALAQSGENVSATPTSSDSPVRLLASVAAGSGDTRQIVGELVNDGPRPVLATQVYAEFLDSNGRKLGAATGYSRRAFVRPQEHDSFTIYLDPGIPDWQAFRVEVIHYVEIDDLGDYTDQLELSVDKFEPDHSISDIGVHIAGTVENASGRSLEYVSVLALLYDDHEHFIGTGEHFLMTSNREPIVLAPGESAPFGLWILDLPSEATSYELYADASIVSP